MNSHFNFCILFLLLLIMSCSSESSKGSEKVIKSVEIEESNDSTIAVIPLLEYFILKESFNKDDAIVNNYLSNELQPIRENFRRVNSITEWSRIDSVNLEESIKGGMADFYYKKNNVLEKIIVKYFAEEYQELNEYYLLEGELSFILERSSDYSRTVFMDSAEMKLDEYGHLNFYDNSEIQTDRSYFKKRQLLHKLESGDCGSPFAKEYIESEQKRLLDQFDKLIEIEKR